MQEAIIQLETNNPVEIFGVNNANLELVKSFFPKLKIFARGNEIHAKGEPAEIDRFMNRMQALMKHFNRYNSLTESRVELILNEETVMLEADKVKMDQVIVYGVDGKLIRAKTKNQFNIVKASEKNDLVFAIGPAGTGKTYTAVALAVRALKNKEVKRIMLCRPAVEAGENLGFLPGDMKEKLDPYLQPLYDALRDMIPADKLAAFMEKHIVEITPLAFMRGRTLDDAFVILDEAQNATEGQMKMFLTRMGANAKFIVTGDETQIDLPRHQRSGLVNVQRVLKDVKGVKIIRLDGSDVVRHKLVKRILEAYDRENPRPDSTSSKTNEKKDR